MSEAAIQRRTRVFPGSQSARWLVLFYRSTIGKKVIMALTGIIGVGFILLHASLMPIGVARLSRSLEHVSVAGL